MAEVKAEKLWEGGLGGPFLDCIAHNTHSIGWDKNEVTHVAVSSSFYMVACRTERREGGKDRDVLNQWLWSCLPCTGALVFVSSVAFSKQAGSPGVHKNAWRVLVGLEIFPPFSAQEKAATNPFSFLTPGPWFALCFHDNLSLCVKCLDRHRLPARLLPTGQLLPISVLSTSPISKTTWADHNL